MPAIAVLAVAGLAVGVMTPADAAPSAKPSAEKAAQTGGKDVSVTLITGDRVLLPGGDMTKATVEPGAGREHVGFNTYRVRDHAYVIPADVYKAVGDGRIDRRLFDVAELVKDGYDDASTSTIPVLTTYAGTAKRAVPAGTRVTRQLPSISGAAMKVSKSNAKAFMSSAGFSKLWLDGKRKLLLDQSVPQIGGPVAWQAGYTGKGVSVAVLDSGVDATHPDLATQIAGEKNFTGESADDLVGHGTHVASTIAGTGAASDGRYKGVAPDARIYDGKICEVWGCEESAILAGMEWAANDVKAKIVNLSIGGQDTPELDPVEEAVNRLTAQSGTLFVIAAGNEGPGDGTISSPGSADAALTVGNVTKQDQLNADVEPRAADRRQRAEAGRDRAGHGYRGGEVEGLLDRRTGRRQVPTAFRYVDGDAAYRRRCSDSAAGAPVLDAGRAEGGVDGIGEGRGRADVVPAGRRADRPDDGDQADRGRPSPATCRSGRRRTRTPTTSRSRAT